MRQLFKSFVTLALLNISIAMAADKTIKIGIAGPFTGPYASFGDQFWLGAEKAVADLNSNGGIDGNQIVLIKADDACNPKQAVQVAQKLVNVEKVTAVIGHFCSAATLAAANIYANNNTLMITPGSTNPSITEQGQKTVFRMCGRDDQQGSVAAKFMLDELKAKKIVIIHDNDTYGKGLADAVKNDLTKRGVKVALFEGFSRGNKDFSALINKIKTIDPDAIYFGGLHYDVGPFVKQLRKSNNKAPVIAGDGIVATDFVTAAGGHKMVKGVYMSFGVDPRTLSTAKDTVKAFQAEQLDPEGYTLYTYAAMQTIAKAIEATHSTDGKQLATWLHNHKVNTVLGEKSWDEKGDLKKTDYIMYEWNNSGKYSPAR